MPTCLPAPNHSDLHDPIYTRHVTNIRHTCNSTRLCNRMVIFPERSSTKCKEYDSLYHLDQIVYNPKDNECNQEESAHYLLAFHNISDSHPRSCLRYYCERLLPPRAVVGKVHMERARISSTSTSASLTCLVSEARKPPRFCYECYGHNQYSTD